MRHLLLGLLLLLTLTAFGCGDDEEPLAGTSWYPVQWLGVRVQFSTFDNNVSGYTGCNSFWGEYSTSGGNISFTDMEWTEAGCPTQEMSDAESAFLDILPYAHEWSVRGFELTLTTRDGKTMRLREGR